MKKTSIQDIANELGVSKGTVSLVLSGKHQGGRISDDMCRKVKQMAERMNYQPNDVARSLSTGKTMLLGIIVTGISNEFFGYLTFHIQEQAKKYGYSVITISTNERLDEFNNAINILLNRQIDGIIFVPVEGGQSSVEKIIKRQVPMVQIDRFYPGICANYIMLDNYKAAFEATELLINKGCKRIAVICYEFDLNALTERQRGCADALEGYGLLDSALFKNINYLEQEENMSRSVYEIKNYKEKVDAIFFCSRGVFITGIKYIFQEGIKVPEDLKLVCFDKIESFPVFKIPVNFIEQPIKEMGEKAVDILINEINGDSDLKQYVFNAKLCFD